MKLVHVCNSLGAGGAERLIIEMSKQAQLKGHRVTIISLCHHIAYTQDIEKYQLDVRCLNFSGSMRKPLSVVQTARCLRALLIELEADIIHSHIFFSDLLVRLVAPRATPVVTTLHTPEPWWQSSTVKHRLKTRAESLSCKRNQGFIAVSKQAGDNAKQYLGLTQAISQINNGVATNTNNIGKRQQSQIGDDKKLRIIQVARFYPEKNHRLALEALALLQQRGIACELHLLGDGPARADIEAWAEQLNIKNQLVLHGICQNVEDHLHNADIFWLTSNREGLPISLLEAMSCALPCVCTNVGEIAQVFEQQSGLLLQQATAECLADATQKLAQDHKLYQKLSENAVERVRSKYSLAAMTDEHLALYKQWI